MLTKMLLCTAKIRITHCVALESFEVLLNSFANLEYFTGIQKKITAL